MEDRKTRLSESRPDPFIGRTVDGYRIDELIGRGGMGEVYRATQLSLNRPVAIKVLPVAFLDDRDFRDRFEREVDVLARLSHPNIVTIFERGEVDGRPYVVMELVQGTSLREVVRRGPLPAAEALVVVRGVLAALEHAHGQGIIHRDVKPENVLLAPGGVVKVADFGLSRVVHGEDRTRLTRTHVMLGTYEYMAPEQREHARDADERSDIYAAGVVLYELIAGDLPIGHFDPLSQRRPNECDSRIDRVVERSMKKEPDKRYQEAADMGAAVSRLLSQAGPVPAFAPMPEAGPKLEPEPKPEPAPKPEPKPRAESIPAPGSVSRLIGRAGETRTPPYQLAGMLVLAVGIVGFIVSRSGPVSWKAGAAAAALFLVLLALRYRPRRALWFAGVILLAWMTLIVRQSSEARQESGRAIQAATPYRSLPSQAVARVFEPLPTGFAHGILIDEDVQAWVRRVARPMWNYPAGVSIERTGNTLEVRLELAKTNPGIPGPRRDYDRVRAALARVIKVRAPEGSIEVTRLAAGTEFEKTMDEDPPPERGK